jgi:hypothetical protein
MVAGWEAAEEDMLAAAEAFHGIDRVQLTGGEPTLHPSFTEWAPRIRQMFGCRQLTVESNGWGFTRFPDAFLHFDRVIATLYRPDLHPYEPDNTFSVEFMQEWLAGTSTQMDVVPIAHIPRHPRGTRLCARGLSETASVFRGHVFPCCVAWGVPGATGARISANWREDLERLPLPCAQCLFAEV